MDMLNAVKSVLADVSSVSPSSEQRVETVAVRFIPVVLFCQIPEVGCSRCNISRKKNEMREKQWQRAGLGMLTICL